LQFAKNKTTAITIAIFLALTIAITLVALPTANAHYPAWTIPTWCFCAVGNNPVGVNQEVLIAFWVQDPPPTAQGAYGDRWTFYVDVTKPDGDTETLGPFTSDPVGSGYATYTPNQIGNYTVVAKFAEHKITGIPVPPTDVRGAAYVNDTYSASESDPINLLVTEEQIEPWPEAPLPTEYWTRPINSANRAWYVLASNWLSGAAQDVGPTNNFAYGAGPESAHVMWATPIWSGGIMDERYGDTGYQTMHYEGVSLSPPIILDGHIYYNVQSLPREGWWCLNLYTGEKEYFHNTTGSASGVSGSSSGSIRGESLAFGQIYDYESGNQHGGFPYLWSTNGPTTGTWMMFDAYTSNFICCIGNTTQTEVRGSRRITTGATGTAVYGKDGSILRYNIVNLGATTPAYYLQVWNTSRAIWWKPSWSSNDYWMWRPGLNVTYDGRNGFSLNVSIPAVQGTIYAVREGQYVIGGTTGQNDARGIIQGNFWALSLKTGQEGTLLWNITFTSPQAAAVPGEGVNAYRGMRFDTISPEDGVFIYREQLTRKYWGFSLETGQQIWETEPEAQMQFYGLSTADCTGVYEGKFFSYGYGGQVVAYDIKTGKILWTYTADNVGFESPYGGNYPVGIAAYCDGKLYLTTSEHSPTQPLFRGSYLRCINATTGEEIWKVLHWSAAMAAGSGVAIADGYVVSLNSYDNQIYCYGKGPSTTTVTASPKISVNGESVLIEGTVTDQSTGAKALAEEMGFANGVAAVSDDSMQAWMEYLYQQQSMPADATGVEVALDTLDPNGNFIHVGTVTSDTSGGFKKMWTPEVPGEYTIIATFAGTKSYYGSYAETYAGVSEAPPPTAPPEKIVFPPTETYILYATIAIIIAIVLVGIWIKKK